MRRGLPASLPPLRCPHDLDEGELALRLVPLQGGLLLMPLFWATLAVQVATFMVLAIIFIGLGQWRLGISQGLLAIIQALIYSGQMK
jgi:hypothetical protein